jgi:hypothetical protein
MSGGTGNGVAESGGLREFGTEMFDRWTAMWNGDLELAGKIMAPAFRLRYAQQGTEAFDDVRTPAELAAVIAAWHTRRGALRFSAEGIAVVDLVPGDGGPSGRVARPYLADLTDDTGQSLSRSGTDILGITDGLITEVWSVSSGVNGRTFYGAAAGTSRTL